MMLKRQAIQRIVRLNVKKKFALIADMIGNVIMVGIAI
jgi:hypothetical protein